MGVIEFSIKFAFGVFLLWLTMCAMAIATTIFSYCWKFLLIGIGVYGVYLACTGKYHKLAEKMDVFYNKLINIVKAKEATSVQ